MNEGEAKDAITGILHPFLDAGTFAAPGWAIKTYLAMQPDGEGKRQADPLPWMSIDKAVCDDNLALVYFSDGKMKICDLDHDSDFEWWKSRGAEKFFYLNPPKESA